MTVVNTECNTLLYSFWLEPFGEPMVIFLWENRVPSSFWKISDGWMEQREEEDGQLSLNGCVLASAIKCTLHFTHFSQLCHFTEEKSGLGKIKPLYQGHTAGNQ